MNRNYDVEWMNAGTSSDLCDDTYGGTEAFSEPESQAHSQDMLSMNNIKGKTVQKRSFSFCKNWFTYFSGIGFSTGKPGFHSYFQPTLHIMHILNL